MTASFSPALEQSLKKLDGTSGPATVDSTVKDPANAADDVADDAYDVEYTMQTGATRYAPMQPVPPTKITAKTAKRQYPTSSVEIAKSKLPIPSVQTTLTQSQTHKVSSMKNTVRNPIETGMDTLVGFSTALRHANSVHRWLQLPCHRTIWRSSLGGGRISLASRACSFTIPKNGCVALGMAALVPRYLGGCCVLQF